MTADKVPAGQTGPGGNDGTVAPSIADPARQADALDRLEQRISNFVVAPALTDTRRERVLQLLDPSVVAAFDKPVTKP